jgi:RNA polymerase sigma factor (sigma-70 family)
MSETKLTKPEIDEIVLEHRGWAISIAKSVARAWSLDWELDGLDGAAMEALIFCAERYEPNRSVPFKSYSRRRIHEASTEAARKSRGWQRGAGSSKRTERLAREVAVELFDIFPDLRSGKLPTDITEEDSSKAARIAIQQLLIGASIIATRRGIEAANPEEALEFKEMFTTIAELEPIHQSLIWHVYWEGKSLRGVATDWETDELNVIREHKVIIEYLQKRMSDGSPPEIPKIRPGLRDIAERIEPLKNFDMFQ